MEGTEAVASEPTCDAASAPAGTGPVAPEPFGETAPESREEGRDTEVGPSETEPREDALCDPPEDRDRDRGGRIAGGGNGGGSNGKVGLSPPGTFGPRAASETSSSTGENVTDFFDRFEPLEDRLRSMRTFS